ncbi:AraC family transcriptional regulator [Herbiconiux sp. 11R-BC]|uniref:AraC family transcriptional regulator n=1 Tax=Herbiconiux sp. 11R-BC TaxID=3111637 RepID=UPI003C02CF9F
MTTVSGTADAHPLSAFLASLRLTATTVGSTALPAGRQQAFDGDEIALHLLVAGDACIAASGECSIVRPGDLVVLPHGGEHTITAIGDAQLTTARLRIDGGPFGTLLAGALPALLMSCAAADADPVVAGVVTALQAEQLGARPGSATVQQGLAAVLAAAVIRRWVETSCNPADPEWSLTLRDPHIARAVEAIHAEPGAPWTVADLARLARSSRSAFSEQFRRTVGEPPLGYLARVRMERAKVLLAGGGDGASGGFSVGETATLLGYRSDEAFSRAFRRHAGATPSAWRRAAR